MNIFCWSSGYSQNFLIPKRYQICTLLYSQIIPGGWSTQLARTVCSNNIKDIAEFIRSQERKVGCVWTGGVWCVRRRRNCPAVSGSHWKYTLCCSAWHQGEVPHHNQKAPCRQTVFSAIPLLPPPVQYWSLSSRMCQLASLCSLASVLRSRHTVEWDSAPTLSLTLSLFLILFPCLSAIVTSKQTSQSDKVC